MTPVCKCLVLYLNINFLALLQTFHTATSLHLYSLFNSVKIPKSEGK